MEISLEELNMIVQEVLTRNKRYPDLPTLGVRNTLGKCVLQYSIEGIFIEEYATVPDACDATGVGYALITRVANPNDSLEVGGGYRWVYKENI